MRKILLEKRERRINVAITEIANDADYQESSTRMVQEFERSHWEALRASDVLDKSDAQNVPSRPPRINS
jgi:hypothetical protein